MSKLKAYIITDKWFGNYTVTFAETSGQAKASVVNSWDFDCEFIYLRAKRKKDWDKYADSKKIPVAELLKNCWWFECKGCGKQITEDDILSGDAIIIDEERNDFVQGGVICKECAEREDRNV